eukprot:TRINITY_DN42438_c0_g1_i1.p1 TRINITY_DN42438_c0_g1~~TRINITY_DN42438_c0_g1_i1.p1  ORF type:complete len:345 (-),score=83.14 TRINITY_DN42438_c0_g1_i1:646-1680(-)
MDAAPWAAAGGACQAASSHGDATTTLLPDFLRRCRIDWTEKDVEAVVRKLQAVGAASVTALLVLLREGALNRVLDSAGERRFSGETLESMHAVAASIGACEPLAFGGRGLGAQMRLSTAPAGLHSARSRRSRPQGLDVPPTTCAASVMMSPASPDFSAASTTASFSLPEEEGGSSASDASPAGSSFDVGFGAASSSRKGSDVERRPQTVPSGDVASLLQWRRSVRRGLDGIQEMAAESRLRSRQAKSSLAEVENDIKRVACHMQKRGDASTAAPPGAGAAAPPLDLGHMDRLQRASGERRPSTAASFLPPRGALAATNEGLPSALPLRLATMPADEAGMATAAE